MPLLARIAIFATLLCGATIAAPAQSSSKASKPPTGSVSGRVTVGGKPAPGVIVVLQLSGPAPSQRPPEVKAATDEEGRFRLTGVAAGRYLLTATAHTFAMPENRSGQPGKSITIAEGETVEGIDLALAPGGVITGRVTYAGGAPFIGVSIELTQLLERGQQRTLYPSTDSRYLYQTDDRGIYRIYGLPAGRYLVSVAGRSFDERRLYPRTFHPGVSDEAQAAIIEVTARGETSNVDIKLGSVLRGYEVSGRIVDGETGRPIAITPPGFPSSSTIDGKQTRHYRFGPGDNSVGEFRLQGLAPGSYTVEFNPQGKGEFYSDPAAFEVTDHDIAGLEIRAQRGASISGVAVIEGASDPATLALLSQLRFGFAPFPPGSNFATGHDFKVGADGRFHIGGLPPSRVVFSLSPSSPQAKSLSLQRVERDSIEQRNSITITAGEQVTGVRLIIAHGTGVVRGQVQIIGGALSEGIGLFISPRRLAASGQFTSLPGVEADARGQFVIEGLTAGIYELSLMLMGSLTNSRPPRVPLSKQTVAVSDGAVSQVTLTLDLSAKEKDQ